MIDWRMMNRLWDMPVLEEDKASIFKDMYYGMIKPFCEEHIVNQFCGKCPLCDGHCVINLWQCTKVKNTVGRMYTHWLYGEKEKFEEELKILRCEVRRWT